VGSMASDTVGDAAQGSYFDMLARIGVTKHFGDVRVTDMLARRCGIDADSQVLEVGCGVGNTASHLARTYGCHVMAVDLSHGMTVHTQAEALRHQVHQLINLGVADAQTLPFVSGYFDVVLVESVSGFLADQPLGFREYARVLGPGDYLGFTEPTWLAPPTAQAENFVATLGTKPLSADNWVALMQQAGFEELDVHLHTVDVTQEAQGCLSQYGCRGVLRAAFKMLPLLIKSAHTRKLVHRATASVSERVYEVLGYGLYLGRKPEA